MGEISGDEMIFFFFNLDPMTSGLLDDDPRAPIVTIGFIALVLERTGVDEMGELSLSPELLEGVDGTEANREFFLRCELPLNGTSLASLTLDVSPRITSPGSSKQQY